MGDAQSYLPLVDCILVICQACELHASGQKVDRHQNEDPAVIIVPLLWSILRPVAVIPLPAPLIIRGPLLLRYVPVKLIVEEVSHSLHVSSIEWVFAFCIVQLYSLDTKYYLQEDPMCVGDINWHK